MLLVILQPVEVLVALAAYLTPIRLLFLHSDSTRVRYGRRRIHNRKCLVRVLDELLILVTVLEHISEFREAHRTEPD